MMENNFCGVEKFRTLCLTTQHLIAALQPAFMTGFFIAESHHTLVILLSG
jgi:hypothetical protein